MFKKLRRMVHPGFYIFSCRMYNEDHTTSHLTDPLGPFKSRTEALNKRDEYFRPIWLANGKPEIRYRIFRPLSPGQIWVVRHVVWAVSALFLLIGIPLLAIGVVANMIRSFFTFGLDPFNLLVLVGFAVVLSGLISVWKSF